MSTPSRQGLSELPHDTACGLEAWQEVQGQWDCIPASHKQLLQLLGVSPQAAVWLACIMPKLVGPQRPDPISCWAWNPYNMAVATLRRNSGAGSSRNAAGDAQLQQWNSTPMRGLMHLLQMYTILYAVPPGDRFILSADLLLQDTLEFVDLAAPHEHMGLVKPTVSHITGLARAWSPLVQEELLLLSLQQVQRLQQLRAAASSDGSPAAATAAEATGDLRLPAAVRAQRLEHAETTGIELILKRAVSIEHAAQGLPRQLSSVSPAAAAAAAAAAEAAAEAASIHSPPSITSASVGTTSASASIPPAVLAAAADQPNPAFSHQVSPVSPAQSVTTTTTAPAISHSKLPDVLGGAAGAIISACESFLRAQGGPALGFGVDVMCMLSDLCSPDRNGKPGVVLGMALEGGGEQQAAFFSLLITLLKLSAVPLYRDVGSACRASVTAGCVEMLRSIAERNAKVAAAASSSSSSKQAGSSGNTSAALWLLLLGRCCFQWAAELAQMQATGADWGQLISGARQLAVEQPGSSNVKLSHSVLAGHLLLPSARSTLPFCFAGRQPLLLVLAQSVEAALRESSSISAVLTAAGYDLGAVQQGFGALAACNPGVLAAQGSAAAAAGNVAGLIKALEAVGRACSVFAVPHCCNNPGCSNVTGTLEFSMVPSKTSTCGACKVARYCGKGRQGSHWKQHKPVCKMLQAAKAQ